jgi:TPR repeat protein
MTRKPWFRKWGASAASVCIAITTNGCSLLNIRVDTETRQDDVKVRSTPVSTPTGETTYSARLSADAGQPVAVSAFQQEMCRLAERQVVDRTLVHTTRPAGYEVPLVGGVLGAAGLVAGGVMGVKGLLSDSAENQNVLFGGAISFGLIGGLLAGGYAYQQLSSGEHRQRVGEVEVDLDHGRGPCGSPVPASQVAVKLVNTEDRGEVLARTDGQGQAVIPDAEVPKLDAPVNLYVQGRSTGVSDAAVERGRAARLSVDEKTCKGGDAQGCIKLGLRYRKGDGVPKDERRATAQFQRACEGGAAEGCGQLGMSYMVGSGVTQDKRRGVALLEKSCEGGDAMGCLILGASYANGNGVPKDERRASAVYEKACEGGQALGCASLGVSYQHGNGVPQDKSRAAALYEKACKGGQALSCGFLGGLYASGQGVPQDERRAAALYEKACEGGQALGCSSLGAYYARGRGVPQDERRAAALFEKACEGGQAESCFILGEAYTAGAFGRPRDPVRAAELKKRAAELGYQATQTEGQERAGPPPDQEAWRTEVAARIARVMTNEDIPRGQFEYLGNCLVRITTDRTVTVSLRSLDHALLTNVEWNDTGTFLGVTYRVVISDRSAQNRASVFMGSVNTAQQVVTGLENMGRSCGAF